MRRQQLRVRMGLRGRSGLLVYVLLGVAVLTAVYYAWNNFLYTSPAKITYSSVQGLKQGHLESWHKQQKDSVNVMEEPPIGLNREIELQMQNEQWKKARALQDQIDEENLLEEGAERNKHKAEAEGAPPKNNNNNPAADASDKRIAAGPLLFQAADPATDGDYFSKLERLVHLDLKGAPPLVSYLEQLFPLLRQLGATGLLVEYEDMFPYSGNLSVLAAGNAYSQADMQRIQEAAKLNALEIIPLVQTFGHMEFVLKHAAFRGLRENDYTPQVITPAKEESYTLLFTILQQIVKAHPNSRRVHLGCDEVYELGQGKSSELIKRDGIDTGKLFLRHVAKIAGHIKDTFPKVQPLIWDDWLRNIPFDVLSDSGLGGLVEPVVWYYQHNIMERVPHQRWEVYGKLFPYVWVASAFKGATGSAQILTNASLHLDNNLQWVGVMRTYALQLKTVRFRGTILTGWQRYDHFATLCELLPVAVPSMALSLQAVQAGGFGARQLTIVGSKLGCSKRLDLHVLSLTKDGVAASQDCTFPGREVWSAVHQLWSVMEGYRRDRGLQERISGWMTPFQLSRGISAPGQMRVLSHKLAKTLDKLKSLEMPLQTSLLKIYDVSTIEEWTTTNIKDVANNMRELLLKSRRFEQVKVWPARPFLEPSAPSVGAAQPDGVQGKRGNPKADVLLPGNNYINGSYNVNRAAQQQQPQGGREVVDVLQRANKADAQLRALGPGVGGGTFGQQGGAANPNSLGGQQSAGHVNVLRGQHVAGGGDQVLGGRGVAGVLSRTLMPNYIVNPNVRLDANPDGRASGPGQMAAAGKAAAQSSLVGGLSQLPGKAGQAQSSQNAAPFNVLEQNRKVVEQNLQRLPQMPQNVQGLKERVLQNAGGLPQNAPQGFNRNLQVGPQNPQGQGQNPLSLGQNIQGLGQDGKGPEQNPLRQGQSPQRLGQNLQGLGQHPLGLGQKQQEARPNPQGPSKSELKQPAKAQYGAQWKPEGRQSEPGGKEEGLVPGAFNRQQVVVLSQLNGLKPAAQPLSPERGEQRKININEEEEAQYQFKSDKDKIRNSIVDGRFNAEEVDENKKNEEAEFHGNNMEEAGAGGEENAGYLDAFVGRRSHGGRSAAVLAPVKADKRPGENREDLPQRKDDAFYNADGDS